MHIAQVGYSVKDDSVQVLELLSNSDIEAFDLVIIRLSSLKQEILNLKYGPTQLRQLLNERSKEIHRILKRGGSVIFVIDNDPIITWNNSSTSLNLLDEMSPFEINFSYEPRTGDRVNVSDALLKLANKVKFSYVATFSETSLPILAKADKSGACVGFYMRAEKGVLTYLPKFIVKHDRSADGVKPMNIAEEIKFMIEALANNVSQQEAPEWIKMIELPGEQKLNLKLAQLTTQLDEINQQIADTNVLLNSMAADKSILYTNGRQLELDVARIFRVMGFRVDQPDANDEDIVLTSEEFLGVVEVKGQKGSAAVKNLAQLEKWVTNYQIDKDKSPKPIMVINTFMDKPILERTEKSFPDNAVEYGEKRNHCLITTHVLLKIYIDFVNNTLGHEEVLQIINGTSGVLHYESKVKW